jgi:hypothetical protein
MPIVVNVTDSTEFKDWLVNKILDQ